MDMFCRNYQKIADGVEALCIRFAALTLLVLLGVNIYSIVADLCLPWSAPWLEEVSALLFSWTTFIAAGVIVRYGGHIGVDLAHRFLKGKLLLLFRLISFACVCWVAWAMFWYGILSMQMSRQSSIYLDIPVSWGYLPIVISGFLLVFFAIAALLPYARKDADAEDMPPHTV